MAAVGRELVGDHTACRLAKQKRNCGGLWNAAKFGSEWRR